MKREETDRKEQIGKERRRSRRQKNRICIIILLIILLLGIGILVFLCVKGHKSDDFAPKLDSTAEQMEDTGEKMDAPEGGGAVSLTYSTAVTISMKDRTAQILFENPSKSTKDTALQLTVKGQKEGQESVIAESELIPAGYKLSQMKLNDDVELETGKYEGNLNVLYYDSETGEKEVVDTKIPVTLTVNNGN